MLPRLVAFSRAPSIDTIRIGRSTSIRRRGNARSLGGIEDLLCVDVIVLNLDYWFPSQSSGVLDCLERRRCPAIEDNIQPVVLAKTLCSAELIRGQRDLANACASLHLDEPRRDKDSLLSRVGLLREQVVALVLALDALDHPTTRALVGNRSLDGET